jgi:Ca2+-binding EF-hand superfamily protein
MARLVSEVDFGYEDLHNLRLEFADASDRSGKDGPYLTCDRLKDMLLARFPSLENGRVLTDMLRVFDVNSNNKIYFPEFARALSKLVGSFEEQMSFIFALCDKDADGQLELWELSDLISDASDDMNELGDHIKARIPTFDDGGGFVEMVEFEALLKSDAHLYLNFYWTWVPFIGGNLLAGLELFEQVAIAVGVLPNFKLALRMCPAFSAAAGLATAGDWKIGALELAQVLFGALGVPVPAGESFRALHPSAGDGVPAKDDGETPRAAEKVGAADGAETPSMAPTKSKDMHFFATPVLTGAQTAPLMFKLSKAVTLIFDELLGAYKRRAAHAAKANPKPGEVDQFGAPLLPIESEGMDEIPAARVWATVAHYLAARGAAGLTKSTRNLDVLSPSGMDFDEQVATSPSGATAVHPGRLTSVPQEIQAAIISRVVAFEAIEDDYHPDPIVSPSSRSLKNPPQLPKIPMAKIFTFTNEVCAIHDAWELTLAEAFEAMDANQDGSVSFDELLKYSRMNRELFQLMIGTGNRKTKGLIEYDAARVAEYDQVAHPEHPLPVLK